MAVRGHGGIDGVFVLSASVASLALGRLALADEAVSRICTHCSPQLIYIDMATSKLVSATQSSYDDCLTSALAWPSGDRGLDNALLVSVRRLDMGKEPNRINEGIETRLGPPRVLSGCSC